MNTEINNIVPITIRELREMKEKTELVIEAWEEKCGENDELRQFIISELIDGLIECRNDPQYHKTPLVVQRRINELITKAKLFV